MGKRSRFKKLKKEAPPGETSVPAPQTATWGGAPEKAITIFLLCALLLTGIALRLRDLDVKGRSPDEGVYTSQAIIVAREGIEGTRRLIGEYNADKQLWSYPPPIRIGYTYLLAAIMKAANIFDERAGTYLSTLCSIGALFMLVLLGLRFFNRWVTVVALVLMSVSPMDLAIARRSWQDSVLAFAGLLLIYCCSELTVNPGRKAWYIPFWLIGSWCILIKESGIIVYGLCVIWLFVVVAFGEKSFIKSALLVVFTLLGIGISVLILGHVAGGIPRVLEVLRNIKDAMPTNTYAIDYQTGPWYRILEGFWILAPVSFVLFIIGIAGVFSGDRRAGQDITAKGLIFIIFSFLFITIVTPYMQNMRYLSVTFVPFYLICGAGVWYLVSLAKNVFKRGVFYAAIAVTALALIFVSIGDYQKFRKIFIKRGIRDTSIRLLRESV
ncbi:MAG: glycosyltransferase family 39 protein [Candidatus Omnitrophica bacterium]|nr:glycosyltransferase family 39 protein [Candidatus Omnitrophota bacterium]